MVSRPYDAKMPSFPRHTEMYAVSTLVCDKDDCGSFSAMVLEDYLKYHKDERIKFYAEFIADYILNIQERLENGMFYRIAEGFVSNIDEEGNIYGVCRGFGYSFRLDYYKHDLACVTNDTHGTGIVLIALWEVEKNGNL